jgi:hypothetical protein
MGRITRANAQAVKIQWDDGEKVTWKRAELAPKELEIVEDENPRDVNATASESGMPATVATPSAVVQALSEAE